MKVLFVCTYNTGRSQMAASLYNKLSKQGHAESVGTITDKAGETLKHRAQYRPAAQHVIDTMNQEGVDVSSNTRDLLTQEMLENYDKVVVMAEPETIPDFLKKSSKYVYWDVKDPKGGDFEVVNNAKELIKQKVMAFINQQR